MANGQANQNRRLHWTQVADELFDVWMPELTGTEWKVICYLVRQTYGWRRETDAISIVQFVRGVGIGERQIQRTLQILHFTGLITREDRTQPDGQGLPSLFRINLDVDWWQAKERLGPARERWGGNRQRGVVDDTGCGVVDDTGCGVVDDTASRHASGVVDDTGCDVVHDTHNRQQSIYSKQQQQQTPRAHVDSHTRLDSHALAGAKGGEVSSCPTGLPPAAVPLRGAAAGGDPRTPSYIEPAAGGSSPQTPQEEGAAAPQVMGEAIPTPDDSLLTEQDHALIASFTAGLPPHKVEQFRQRVIQGRRETALARSKACSEGVGFREARPTPEYAARNAQDQNPGLTPLKLVLGMVPVPGNGQTPSGFGRSSIEELASIGIEEETARELLAKHGERKVQGWLTTAKTKKKPSGYLMTLASIAERKRT